MMRFITTLWDSSARYQSALLGEGEEVRARLQDQHLALLEAFKQRDAETVNRLMVAHRAVTLDAMRDALATREPAAAAE